MEAKSLPAPSIWRTAAKAVRTNGIKGLWFKTLGEIGYRRAVVRERRLDQPFMAPTARIPLEFSMLDAAGIDEYNAFRQGRDPHAARRQIEAGHRCFLARSSGRIVGACWSANQRAWSMYLSRDIPLAPDEVYTYDAFIAADLRGKGILPALTAEMHRVHRSLGMRREIGVTVPENRAAMNSNIGYHSAGIMGYYALGPFRRDFCIMKSGFTEPGKDPRRGATWDHTLQSLDTRGYRLDSFLAQLKRDSYLSLIEKWGGVPCNGRVLKTDLFEEAMGADAFLSALSRDDSMLLGMDVSKEISVRAQHRDEQKVARYITADACNLPFASDSFALIVSPSTLDHFKDPGDLANSLRELARILTPDGRLIITLDNRQNIFDPLLRLANRIGLVPFYLGRSYTVNELRRELEAAGLKVLDTTAIVHHPRLTAVAAVGVAKRIPSSLPMRAVQAALRKAQRLQDTRVQYFSGCFVAALAVRSNT
ncbi:MAG TPA: class I SAM-dependent methyltransferase [Gemmatimonadaceae bacterium]|nr:class I SAM-dependent methyltransferase [Gemmatimonadaceae bacterium]